MGTTVFERSIPAVSTIDHSLTNTHSSPFWLADLDSAQRFPSLTSSLTADLVIVGGGYCGLWTAILAKERHPNKRIVLLEGKTIAWAASSRNGGFCEASLTHGEDNGNRRWPKEMPQLNRIGMENLDAIEATVRTRKLDCDFERNGSIDIATEQHQVEWLKESVSGNHDSPDSSITFLDTEAVRARVNSQTYLAGVFHKNTSALVHPAKLAYELARVALELGVEIFENSRVIACDTSGLSVSDGCDVVTAKASVRARHVALATNVFPSLLKRNRLMTVPVYDYALMTEPLTQHQLASIGWDGREGLGDMANQFHYYRLSADNRILFGGYDAIYHFASRLKQGYEQREETYRKLASHFFTTFPQLDGLRFEHKWAGAIDTSTRFCAFFGTARDKRIAYATGFTGLGVASTRFAANVMLDTLDGVSSEITELEMVKKRPLPFPPEPFAFAGIQATRWSLNRADHSEGKRNILLKTLDALGLGFDS